jgi:hypothetical protein
VKKGLQCIKNIKHKIAGPMNMTQFAIIKEKEI